MAKPTSNKIKITERVTITKRTPTTLVKETVWNLNSIVADSASITSYLYIYIYTKDIVKKKIIIKQKIIYKKNID